MKNFANIQMKVYPKKTEDFESIKEKVKDITDFCNKHDIGLSSSFNRMEHYILVDIIAEGLTTRYCRGVVHEVKQMYKEAFKCKIDVLLEAY